MSGIVYALPSRVLPVQQAAQRLWEIRRLFREGCIDPLAADTALRPLRAHPNLRVAWLASQTTEHVVAQFHAARAP